MNNITEEIDSNRIELREARKQRRKEKKLIRQDKKEKEKEMRTLALKFGPRDSHVTIVTREFAQKLTVNKKPNNIPEMIHNDVITDENFPVLGEHSVRMPDNRSVEIETKPEPVCTKRSKSAITINLNEIITSDARQVTQEKKKKVQPVKVYEGNILDSSQPERKRGKHREVPKKKKLSKIKSLIQKENGDTINFNEFGGIHSSSFQIYCDNCVTEELNNATTKLLKEIVNFQEKLYQRDPIKAVSKRRYVIGLHEVKKFLKVDKLRIIIIAPNINITLEEGILNNVITDIKQLAIANEIPYVFALTRRKMGRLCLKTVPVSCVGILDISGAEESFSNVIELIQVTRNSYKEMLPVEDDNKNEVIEELRVKILQALK